MDVLMFEKKLCLEGVSARQIAMRLTEMGIPTQQGNKDWNRGVVLQHLTNGNYRGYPMRLTTAKPETAPTLSEKPRQTNRYLCQRVFIRAL